MRKSQSQPALAALTEADREKLADWLRREEYDVVLERVNQPRPEGFGLSISKKPLQTFYAKVALLDLINSRLSDDKKLSLATFESLAQADIFLFSSAENSKVAEVHNTILGTVHDLAKSGDNTPTQLLALQRLADFPARAELREQRAELDLQKFAHKVEVDDFRKHIATENLAIKKRRLELTEEKAKSNSTPDQQEDELGPVAHDWEGVRARARKAFNITPEESARRAALRRTWQEPPVHPTPDLNPTLTPSSEAAPAKPLNIIDLLKDLAALPELQAWGQPIHQPLTKTIL